MTGDQDTYTSNTPTPVPTRKVTTLLLNYLAENPANRQLTIDLIRANQSKPLSAIEFAVHQEYRQ